jgi:hypothetical protein
MLRALNFMLWIAALTAIWGNSPQKWAEEPIGFKWVPVAGLAVSIFWPVRAKRVAKSEQSPVRPPN